MKVILINPPLRTVLWNGGAEHLGLGYLAAVLRVNKFEVEILDVGNCYIKIPEIVKVIKKKRPELIGASVPFQHLFPEVLKIAKALRRAGIREHITIGGHFPSFYPFEILRDFPVFDSIVVGEGEETFLELTAALSKNSSLEEIKGLAYHRNGEIKVNPPRPLIKNLDELPFPARDALPLLLRTNKKDIDIITSRGCYAHCSFCSVHSFYQLAEGPIWRARSPENIVDELETLIEKFGIRCFDFSDDNFIGPGSKGKERAFAIGEEIEKRDLKIEFTMDCRARDVDKELLAFLKKVGLKQIFIGVESGSETGLKTYSKQVSVEENAKALATIDKSGIERRIGYIMFNPYTTWKEFSESFL